MREIRKQECHDLHSLETHADFHEWSLKLQRRVHALVVDLNTLIAVSGGNEEGTNHGDLEPSDHVNIVTRAESNTPVPISVLRARKQKNPLLFTRLTDPGWL